MSRNRFEGRCYQCGRKVEAGTGHYERFQRGWRVKHANIAGDGRVTCAEAQSSFTYEDYLDTLHPFAEEGFQP